MQLGTVGLLVVHRGDVGVRRLSLLPRGGAVEAGGRGHVEPLAGADRFRIVHHEEAGALLVLEGVSGRAVSLVADGDVERRHAGVLRLPDHVHRLVGAENDRQPIGRIRRGRPREPPGVGRGGYRQVVRLRAVTVPAPDLLVRADGESADRGRGVGRPLPQRLGDERDRGRGEQHPPAGSGDLLGDAQRREGLAGAAGHDQLAAVVLLETRERVGEGLSLVRSQLLCGARLQRRRLVLEVGVPVDRGLLEPEEVDALHRGLLIRDEREQVPAPVGGRADDHALVEVGVRVREEGGEVLLVERA